MEISFYRISRKKITVPFILIVLSSLYIFHTMERNASSNWTERKMRISHFCDQQNAEKIKIISVTGSDRKIVDNIVHVSSLNLNWCLGKALITRKLCFLPSSAEGCLILHLGSHHPVPEEAEDPRTVPLPPGGGVG